MIAVSGLVAKEYYVTAEGAAELRRRLDELRQSRTTVASELRSLSAQSGDALEDPLQAFNYRRAEELEGQIGVLERILSTVRIIAKPKANNYVQLGSRVTVVIDATEYTYTILGSLEADPAQGKISDESPLGLMLMGRKLQEQFVVTLGARQKTARIIAIG